MLLLGLALAPLPRVPAAHAAPAGGGDSQIDEGAADDRSGGWIGGEDLDLAGRLAAYAAGSLAKYDAVKSEAAVFRRQGWFPSCWVREPEADVVLEDGPPGTRTVTVVVSCARRDIDHRLVLGPLERFLLPGADRLFFAELVAALAAGDPEIGRARVRFSFAELSADGRLLWEDRGGLAMTAAAARGVAPGKGTQQSLWPLLEEDTVSPEMWPE